MKRLRLSRLLVMELMGLAVLAVVALWLARVLPDSGRGPAPAAPLVPAATATPTPTQPPATTPTPLASQTAAPRPTLTTEPTAAPAIVAEVMAGITQLRLRASPGTAGEILANLSEGAALTVVGRTEEQSWLEVVAEASAASRGWVSAAYVNVTGDVQSLPVTGEVADAPMAGFISGITAHAREIFLRGLSRGKRDFAFSLVGDSNTDHPAFLAPFDLGQYDLGDYGHLQLTVDYFQGSFARDSRAAVGSFNTSKVLDPAFAGLGCEPGESPLACEYRQHQPSVALILLGTGDQHSWEGFEARYRQIIEYSLSEGVVPVLQTKADDLESLENTAPPGYINDTIRRLALEYDIPLLDLRRAVEGLPNRGTIADGFHYNSPPDGRSAFFDEAHLQYGFTVRNLAALQVLDALRQYVLYAP